MNYLTIGFGFLSLASHYVNAQRSVSENPNQLSETKQSSIAPPIDTLEQFKSFGKHLFTEVTCTRDHTEQSFMDTISDLELKKQSQLFMNRILRTGLTNDKQQLLYEIVCKKMIDPNYLDTSNQNILLISILNGYPEIALALVPHMKESINAIPSYPIGLHAMFFAVAKKYKTVAKAILDNPFFNPNIKCSSAETLIPLLYKNGMNDLVDSVLKHPEYDPNLYLGESGYDFAYLLVKGSDRHYEAIINHSGFDSNQFLDYFSTPLFTALNHKQNDRTLQLLTAKGDQIDFNSLDKFGNSLLMVACANANDEVVNRLLDEELIDMLYEKKSGLNALSIALDKKRIGIALNIIKKLAELDFDLLNKSEQKICIELIHAFGYRINEMTVHPEFIREALEVLSSWQEEYADSQYLRNIIPLLNSMKDQADLNESEAGQQYQYIGAQPI